MKQVQEELYDPVRERVRYGAMAKLIAHLLQQWLDEGAPKYFLRD